MDETWSVNVEFCLLFFGTLLMITLSASLHRPHPTSQDDESNSLTLKSVVRFTYEFPLAILLVFENTLLPAKFSTSFKIGLFTKAPRSAILKCKQSSCGLYMQPSNSELQTLNPGWRVIIYPSAALPKALSRLCPDESSASCRIQRAVDLLWVLEGLAVEEKTASTG
jgi:hypothetical protein